MTSTYNPERKRSSSWHWIWFAYTGFLFIDPIFDPSRRLWLLTGVVFILFLGVFVAFIQSRRSCKTIPVWIIVATFVLGLASFPWNQGASTFFIYTAAFLPFCFASITKVIAGILIEAFFLLAEEYVFHAYHGFLHVTWPNTLIAIFLMSVIGGSNIFFAEQKRAETKLRAAQHENVALAAVAERERIARDLHDVLGHTLSVIVLKAELAGRLMQRNEGTDRERASVEITDLEGIARTSLAEVREAIGGYRSRGLAGEIDAARLTLTSAGVALVLDGAPAAAGQLSAAEETALALAIREAVTNIVRHARATTCTMRFVSVDDRRRLVVEDDGKNPAVREGNGLRGMRERIESLGGQFSLERDHGTRLIIELPLRGLGKARAAAL